MEEEDGWRVSQGISAFMAQHNREKRTPEKQNIQRCFSSAAPGVAALPEMSDWHWEDSLQGDHTNWKEGDCREDNS